MKHCPTFRMNRVLLMDMHFKGFIWHLLMGVFDIINFCEPKWLWADMFMYGNDSDRRDLVAGSLLYKGHMI